MKEPLRNGSYSMGKHNDEIMAFDQPRLLTRSDLENIKNEITAVITLFRRRLK